MNAELDLGDNFEITKSTRRNAANGTWVTAAMQTELEAGRRSTRIDAHDVIDLLLALADEIDSPFEPCDARTGPPDVSR